MSQPVTLLPTAVKDCGTKPAWKRELAEAETSAINLLERLKLSEHRDIITSSTEFRCLVTDSYIAKMVPGDIDDPLLLQVLPMQGEVLSPLQERGLPDPVGDLNAQVSPGILHKYKGRALLITTGACAIHCRYCFRRHYPYPHASYSNRHLQETLEHLRKHDDIDEVILSGGDPLVLCNERLAFLIEQLEPLSQLTTLRIHSRLPVVLPERIDEDLVRILGKTRLQVVIVIHCNHARELQQSEQARLAALKDAGISLLNQSVLLRGVNDNAEDLIALSKRLFACHTLPYYLHMLDPTRGAMHFHVDTQRALDIHRCLTDRLPGYLVPRLVREQPGMTSKTAISRI